MRIKLLYMVLVFLFTYPLQAMEIEVENKRKSATQKQQRKPSLNKHRLDRAQLLVRREAKRKETDQRDGHSNGWSLTKQPSERDQRADQRETKRKETDQGRGHCKRKRLTKDVVMNEFSLLPELWNTIVGYCTEKGDREAFALTCKGFFVHVENAFKNFNRNSHQCHWATLEISENALAPFNNLLSTLCRAQINRDQNWYAMGDTARFYEKLKRFKEAPFLPIDHWLRGFMAILSQDSQYKGGNIIKTLESFYIKAEKSYKREGFKGLCKYVNELSFILHHNILDNRKNLKDFSLQTITSKIFFEKDLSLLRDSSALFKCVTDFDRLEKLISIPNLSDDPIFHLVWAELVENDLALPRYGLLVARDSLYEAGNYGLADICAVQYAELSGYDTCTDDYRLARDACIRAGYDNRAAFYATKVIQPYLGKRKNKDVTIEDCRLAQDLCIKRGGQENNSYYNILLQNY
jgi:hypothetical protein